MSYRIGWGVALASIGLAFLAFPAHPLLPKDAATAFAIKAVRPDLSASEAANISLRIGYLREAEVAGRVLEVLALRH